MIKIRFNNGLTQEYHEDKAKRLVAQGKAKFVDYVEPVSDPEPVTSPKPSFARGYVKKVAEAKNQDEECEDEDF